MHGGRGSSTPRWRTSSYTDQDNCVEVATLDKSVGVRDSKVDSSPVINIAPRAWASLVG